METNLITDSGVKPFPAQELGDQLRRRDVVVRVDTPCARKAAMVLPQTLGSMTSPSG